MKKQQSKRVIPGFGLTMGVTLAMLSIVVLIPLASLAVYSARLGFREFIEVITRPRVLSGFYVSFITAFAATVINAIMGLVLAWVLVRYDFPGKRIMDGMIELPFALPYPFSCSYCLSSIDKRLRFRSLDLVKKELQFFIDNNTNQVKFVDRTFNCNKKHAMEIWSYIKKHDNGVTNFHFEIAADLMTEEEIALISDMRPGLIQLEIGVQSTNEKTLEAINRKTDIEKIAEITEKIHHSGNIHQHLDLIAGLPNENYESFKRSFDQVYAMKPDQFQLGFLKVLYGSMMKENSEKYGMAYSGRAPYEVLKTNWVSFDDILKLKEVEAVVEIYYNSFQFENTIRKLSELYESPFELYEQLGSFYQRHSENGEKHSRVKRYELLLNFIKKRNFEENIQWEELLTKDFYLRENAKSRPGFSKNIEKYKHQIREFFKGEEVRTILVDYEDYDSKQLEKMTHVEVFGINEDNLTYILFDYKHRNPLNKQAKLINITKQIKR